MGNTTSSTNETNSSDLVAEIDKIASKYILSQNFEDMNKLSDKNSCDKLVILTAKIINQNLNSSQQKELLDRIKPPKAEGEEKDLAQEKAVDIAVDMDKQAQAQQAQAQQAQAQQAQAQQAQAQQPAQAPAAPEQTGGKKTCEEIAAFYVKIAHLYAAIMKTINPIIVTKDANGTIKKYDLMGKQNMPTDKEIKSIEHNNFCTSRLNILLKQQKDFMLQDQNNKFYKVVPRFCTEDIFKNGRKFYKGKGTSKIGGKKKNKGDEDDDDDDDEDEKKNKKKKKDEDDDEDEEKGKGKEKGNGKDKDKDKGKDKDKSKDSMSRDSMSRDSMSRDSEDDENDEDNEKKRKETTPTVVKDKPMTDENYDVGIPELIKLYYDIYDTEAGEYNEMSPEMSIIYQRDLNEFYKTFNNNNDIPTDQNGVKSISSFEQIQLNNISEECKKDGKYTKTYEISSKPERGEENLFVKYKNHTQDMNNNMNATQTVLLGILKKLFKFQAPAKKNDEEEEKKEKEEEEKKEKEEEEKRKKEKEKKEKEEEDAKVVAPMAAPAQAAPAPVAAPLVAPAPAAPAVAPITSAPTSEPITSEPITSAPITSEPIIPANKVGGAEGSATDAIDDVIMILDPELDEDLLKTYVNSARQNIMNMYIQCEKDFLKGIIIFESIIARTLGQTTANKINFLNEKVLEIYTKRGETYT